MWLLCLFFFKQKTAYVIRISDWSSYLCSSDLPVMSYLGPVAANVVTGSVIVVQIFSLPGIGRFFVQGAINRDYGLVMGIVILYATVLILLNLLVDIAYGWLDPRARVK